MGNKIYCNGKEWTVSEYNELLSKENKIDEEYNSKYEDIDNQIAELEKKRSDLEKKQKKECKDVWIKNNINDQKLQE